MHKITLAGGWRLKQFIQLDWRILAYPQAKTGCCVTFCQLFQHFLVYSLLQIHISSKIMSLLANIHSIYSFQTTCVNSFCSTRDRRVWKWAHTWIRFYDVTQADWTWINHTLWWELSLNFVETKMKFLVWYK